MTKKLLVLAALTLSVTRPAFADPVVKFVPFVRDSFGHTPFTLDVQGASFDAGTPVIQWYDNGNANQQWIQHDLRDGTFGFENVNSRKCLKTNGTVGQQLFQDNCNIADPLEHWQVLVQQDGRYVLQNPQSKLVMDVNGQNYGAAGDPVDGFTYKGDESNWNHPPGWSSEHLNQQFSIYVLGQL